jgi:ribosome-associated translation inhibitor RaiA
MPIRSDVRQLAPEDVVVVLRGDLPLGVREYATEKVAHSTRLSGRPVLAAHVVVAKTSDPDYDRAYRVDAMLDVAGTPVRAEGRGARPREAVDVVVERLERQVVSLVKRWHERSRWLAVDGHERQEARRFADVPADDREVVRRKTFAIGAQTADEAAFDMEALDHDFYLFVDAATDRDALVHRRDDGRYGVAGLGVDAELPASVVAEPDPPVLDEVAARERLDVGGEPFVFYLDAASDRGHVVYRRFDGHYGLISPA